MPIVELGQSVQRRRERRHVDRSRRIGNKANPDLHDLDDITALFEYDAGAPPLFTWPGFRNEPARGGEAD